MDLKRWSRSTEMYQSARRNSVCGKEIKEKIKGKNYPDAIAIKLLHCDGFYHDHPPP